MSKRVWIFVYLVLSLKKTIQYDNLNKNISSMNRNASILVSHAMRNFFVDHLKAANISYSILIENIHELKNVQISNQTPNNDTALNFDYDKYNRIDQIQSWIDGIRKDYPRQVTVFEIGKSFEKRAIRGIKIALNNGTQNKRPAIFVEGGIHPREWISTATVLYIAKLLLSENTSKSDNGSILNAFDFYILPVLNVDGHEYSQTEDRMWRKTRSYNGPANSCCYGVDLNRNWDVNWQGEDAQHDPCSEAYIGKKPFSENEAKSLADFLSSKNDTIVSYLSFHSFTQRMDYPYGYKADKPLDFAVLNEGARIAVEALSQLYGTKYKYGSIFNDLYAASGSSLDWAYEKAGIKYSYAFELRDTGDYGLFAPPSEIKPTALETFQAIKALANYIKSVG